MERELLDMMNQLFISVYNQRTAYFDKKAVLKCSICTGEQVAGFKDIHTGHFDEIMLIRNAADLDAFMEMYDVAAISREY